MKTAMPMVSDNDHGGGNDTHISEDYLDLQYGFFQLNILFTISKTGLPRQ